MLMVTESQRAVWVVVVFLLGVFIKGVIGDPTTYPTALAVRRGDIATIQCTAVGEIRWEIDYLSPTSRFVIAINCTVRSDIGFDNFKQVFWTSRNGSRCDLIVNASDYRVVARYDCFETYMPTRVNPSSTYLTMLNSLPYGTQVPTNVVGGDIQTTTCYIEYQAPYQTTNYRPYLNMSGETLYNVTSTDDIYLTHAISSGQVIMPRGPAVVPPINCTLFFLPPVVYTTYTWTSNETTVQYCATNVRISPAVKCVSPGTTFNCTADAYPPPVLHQWTKDGIVIGNQSQVTLPDQLKDAILMCTVTNNVISDTGGSRPCSSSMSHVITVSAYCNGNEPNYLTSTTIALGVFLGLTLCVDIVCLIIVFRQGKISTKTASPPDERSLNDCVSVRDGSYLTPLPMYNPDLPQKQRDHIDDDLYQNVSTPSVSYCLPNDMGLQQQNDYQGLKF